MEITRNDFGENFSWGVATAAYQIEGAHDAHGKGVSIWDQFTSKKGRIHSNHNGNVSVDHYNRYHDDIMLMKRMNIPNYRFSLSWSRIFPTGTGTPNRQGVDFYSRVIDLCLSQGIQPWITIYHWDLPLELEKKGGWTNRAIIEWFSDYASFCIRQYGDRVTHWMILNEPMVFTGAGYFLGIHAPGKKGLLNFLAAAHHAALCQATGGRIAKSLNGSLQIGTTFSCSQVEPYRNNTADNSAAFRMDALLNRTFIEPMLGLSYPSNDLKVLSRIEQFVKDGDEQKLPFSMDFIGIQNYTREIVRHDFFTPFLRAKIVTAAKRKAAATMMGWEVYPASIYHMLKKYAAYENMPSMIITESGAAFEDRLTAGSIHDIQRTAYLKDHLQQVRKARTEGVDVNGFFVWSFLDNFEWAEGYRPPFGIVHVDLQTQQRTIKHSGLWYKDFLDGCTVSPTIRPAANL
ncbi:MAG: GH1 family beta-glucosidase [Chitinophagaceae bacterium]